MRHYQENKMGSLPRVDRNGVRQRSIYAQYDLKYDRTNRAPNPTEKTSCNDIKQIIGSTSRMSMLVGSIAQGTMTHENRRLDCCTWCGQT